MAERKLKIHNKCAFYTLDLLADAIADVNKINFVPHPCH